MFLSPLWLLSLLPLSALALALFLGRRRSQHVPFLPLWSGPADGTKPKRAYANPPIPIVLLIVAAMCAALAAAGPANPFSTASRMSFELLIDRGRTMPSSRRANALERLPESIDGSTCAVRFIPSVENEPMISTDSKSASAGAADSAVDTTPLLDAAIRAELDRSNLPLVVVTDRPVQIHDARLSVLGPSTVPANVGLAAVALRETPHPQLMAVVRNDSAAATGELTVTPFDSVGQPVAGQSVSTAITLPPRGERRSFFLDMPRPSDITEIHLTVDGPPGQNATTIDDTAWLVRRRGWPAVEPAANLAPHLSRMADVYTRLRPASFAAPRVVVRAGLRALLTSPTEPALAFADADVAYAANPPAARIRLEDHAVTSDVDWSKAVAGAQAGLLPGEGFRPLVSVGPRVYVAVRESPARQVWVGFDTEAWSHFPDFVVFASNALEWIDQGNELFTTENPVARRPVSDRKILGASASETGVYLSLDSSQHAASSLDVDMRAVGVEEMHWNRNVYEFTQSAVQTVMLIVSVGLVLCAAGVDAGKKDRG